MTDAPALTLDPESGRLQVSGRGEIAAGAPRREVERAMAGLLDRAWDHGNGFAWQALKPLTFGGVPAVLAVCFHDGRVSEAGWNVELPDAQFEGGWPTRETSDAEVRFMREELYRQIGRRIGEEGLTFGWGALWCAYDQKGGFASAGLRYA